MSVKVEYMVFMPLTDQSGGNSESFEEYAERVKGHVPLVPEEVLRDWLYKHGKNGPYVEGSLDIPRLRFRKESWSTERILRDVTTFQADTIDGYEHAIGGDFHRNGRLGRYMIEHGTWPVPPVVLDNAGGLMYREVKAFHRYHLLEGHHRLGYLRGLASDTAVALQAQHLLWLAT